MELDESTDVPNEDRRWIADNVATDADFDDLWPGLDELIRTLPPAPTYLLIFNWDGFPGAPERPSMAFSLRGELRYALYCAWDDPADDEKCKNWTTDRMKAWEPQAWGTMLADENLINRPSRFMAAENLRRLDSVRAKWDPDNVFVAWLGRPAAP